MTLMRTLVALIAPLALTSCFLTPGKFVSSIDVRKDGTFSVAYKGEVIFSSPDSAFGGASQPKPWHDGMAVCPNDGDPYTNDYASPDADPDAATDSTADTYGSTKRPCTKAEIAKLRQTREADAKAKAAKTAEENRKFAAIFGFGGDDEGNRKFAERLMKEKGWKSVTYRGDGVFDVDYQLSGRIDHDFVFPVMPNQEVIIPFILLRTRADGAVTISAPAMSGGAYRAKAMRGAMPGGRNETAPGSDRIDGVLTVTTDGEILTNNTLDGPTRTATGRTLTWQVGPESDRIPEALIALK